MNLEDQTGDDEEEEGKGDEAVEREVGGVERENQVAS